MTTTRQLPARLTIATAALTALALLTVGCGSSTPKAAAKATTTTVSTNDPTNSDYCQTVRKWVVHQFDGEGDSIGQDPVVFKQYWTDYMDFVTTATKQSPAELRNDWQVAYAWLGHEFTPILVKYDYDVARAQDKGTPAELAIGKRVQEGGNSEEQHAAGAVRAYEARVCQSDQPPAADVSFADAKPNKAYCDAVKAGDELSGKVAEAKWSIDAVRAFTTSAEFAALADKAKQNAPAEIKADVEADVDWQLNQQKDVIEKYGYDARKLLLDGSAADRAIFQRSDPAIADHYARTVAYEQQVCGL